MTTVTNKSEKSLRNPVLGTVLAVGKDGSTAKVAVARIVQNKLYGKRERLRTSLHVDVADKKVKAGDFVRIVPCRKLSRTKSWRVLEVEATQG